MSIKIKQRSWLSIFIENSNCRVIKKVETRSCPILTIRICIHVYQYVCVRVYSVLAITLYNILILDVIGHRSESCVPNSRMSVAIFRPGNIAFPTLYKEE
jgi:hypothetical protein